MFPFSTELASNQSKGINTLLLQYLEIVAIQHIDPQSILELSGEMGTQQLVLYIVKGNIDDFGMESDFIQGVGGHLL